jgi:hypothetical protein
MQYSPMIILIDKRRQKGQKMPKMLQYHINYVEKSEGATTLFAKNTTK